MDEKTIKSDPTSLDSVKSVVDSVVAKHAKSVNDLVKEISSIQSLTEEQIQDYLHGRIKAFTVVESTSLDARDAARDRYACQAFTV